VAQAREEGFGSQVHRYRAFTQIATAKRTDRLVSQMITSNERIARSNNILTVLLVVVAVFEVLALVWR
jgi:hypothetical protein